MDRGYIDFSRLHRLTQSAAFFIVRARANFRFRRLYSHPIDRSSGLRCDQTVRTTGVHSAHTYPDKLRRVSYRDLESGKTLTLLTNNFTLPALTIARLYKRRWQVELFFKWIKQHLRIKRFYGTSENAVKTQVWIAVSVYVLVAIIRKRLHLDLSLYTILQILSVTVFEKAPLFQVLTKPERTTDNPLSPNQLNLFD
jgi:IS4 transposase